MSSCDSALHSQGASRFTDDIALPEGALFALPLLSTLAHGVIKGFDATAALALPGVIAVLTAADIPGRNQIGNIGRDEWLLAETEVVYHGQPIALLVAETEAIARHAADFITVDYQALPAVFDSRKANFLGQHLAPKRVLAMGDVASAWAQCDVIVEGSASTGAQEHCYLEPQTAHACPLENGGVHILAATQSPGATQKIIARLLGVAMHCVEVDVLRLGGGFGGKEEQATTFAALAALAAWRLQRPVRLCLQRDEDSQITGKRHPYDADFKIGLTRAGKILAYQVDFFQNAGAWADLSLAILERTLFHACGSYFIPHVQVGAISCRTHLPPNTAFRGFGAPQAMFVLEAAIDKAARALQLAPETIQRANLIQETQHFYYGMRAQHSRASACCAELLARIDWPQRQQAVNEFNAGHATEKKGLALMPVCFGIAFTATFLNQADALVHVYSDGSVSVSCGAVEMGQGVNRKIAKVVAATLGIAEQRVKVASTNTSRIANMSPTAASTGADLNGMAAQSACLQILQRLLALAADILNVAVNTLSLADEKVLACGTATALTWEQLVTRAYLSRTALSAQAHYATPALYFDRDSGQGQPFAYHVYGCAAVEVTVDCLRGTYRIEPVDIVHDVGHSLDQTIDRGQVEGAVVQGLGWMTLEEVLFSDDGRLITGNLSRYKIPDIHFAPDINVHFLVNHNPVGLMHSKAVGEPPLMYGIGVYFALVQAIKAFNPAWSVDYRAPLTPERVLLALYQRPAAV